MNADGESIRPQRDDSVQTDDTQAVADDGAIDEPEEEESERITKARKELAELDDLDI